MRLTDRVQTIFFINKYQYNTNKNIKLQTKVK